MNKDELKSYLDKKIQESANLPYPVSDEFVVCYYQDYLHNEQNYLELILSKSNTHEEEKYIVFPIKINVSYQIEEKIILKDLQNNEMGYLYPDKEINIEYINLAFYAAFLTDTDEIGIESSQYKLTKPYLVLKSEYLVKYLDEYKLSSILWGGFYHGDDNKTSDPILQPKTEIICLANLDLRTIYHHENAQRAIQQPYAFERFLKNYHLLELLYDVIVVKKVQALGEDIYGASKILKEYNKGEDMDRLKDVISSKLNSDKIRPFLDAIIPFKDIAVEIFYTYGKSDSNPLLVSKEDFDNPLKFTNIITHGGFSLDNVKTHNNTKQEDYHKFIIKLTAYYIYRIRSSIAHSKMGEFLLTSTKPEHEKFMVKFAEPLLQEVLIQCFPK